MLLGSIRYSCVYIVRMSPTLSRSLALQCVTLGDALEIRNGITFDFYSGLPHIHLDNVYIVPHKTILTSHVIISTFRL